MCGTETDRRRECVGHTRDLSLPGCCNTGIVSARSAFPHREPANHTSRYPAHRYAAFAGRSASTQTLFSPPWQITKSHVLDSVATRPQCGTPSIFSCHGARLILISRRAGYRIHRATLELSRAPFGSSLHLHRDNAVHARKPLFNLGQIRKRGSSTRNTDMATFKPISFIAETISVGGTPSRPEKDFEAERKANRQTITDC